ncbi:NADPH:quinone reductase [Leuconostoc litchii]|uniref:NADP-dependent oxidoreductase n=1 Tax=Leuconostoc litchii TaxID=1981069 RepID=A0A6P2CN71_9LACO|nr:NADP-dependent oxidoreductase [Leuconostoc litchii]TYC47034.1 NADP-dependent oxidoreductase [Leuconostoc litchii]GMA68958.1 NADPH:quinone reductase [Leuconostoc litchii]
MKAAIIKKYGDVNELEVTDIDKPAIKADEVLVENKSTSINPIDYKARQGLLQSMFPWQFPVVLGWDLAGKIVATGDQVIDFKVGDEVFARPDIDVKGINGAYAEYTAVKADKLALKPENISFEEAAAVPLAGLTALQMLRQLNLVAGQKILIQAGAGGVGIYAIQLAKKMGAFVATTASPNNHELVKSLGADLVIDYHKTPIQKILSNYDAVLDTVGDIEHGIDVLKSGGHFVTISSTLTDAQKQITDKHVMTGWLKPNGQDLAILADAISSNQLKIVIDSVYPFTTKGIRSAHERSETHHSRGKVIVKIKD